MILVKLAKKFLTKPFLGIPMKTNTLGTTLLVIGVMLGMSAWMLHDRGEIALPDSPPKNQNTIVLTNTGTSSGTIQVVNSGVTDFHMPNLEWKSRDVTLADGRTLHYVFGEGNPKGVGLTEEEKEIYKKCLFEENLRILSCGGIGNEVFGYVTPDVEKDLLDFLVNPLWGKVLSECRLQFEDNEYPVSSEFDVNYVRVLSGGVLDINKILEISDQDGRKMINMSELANWFQNAITEKKEVFGKDILSLDNCITRNGGLELYRLMDSVYMKRFYPI